MNLKEKLPLTWQEHPLHYPVCKAAESRWVGQIKEYQDGGMIQSYTRSLHVGWADGTITEATVLQKRLSVFGEPTYLGLNGQDAGIIFTSIPDKNLIGWGYWEDYIEYFAKMNVHVIALRPLRGELTMGDLNQGNLVVEGLDESDKIEERIKLFLQSLDPGLNLVALLAQIYEMESVPFNRNVLLQNTVDAWKGIS